MCKPALHRFPTRPRRLTTVFPTAVPLLSRPINMRPSTGREVETSLPSRLPVRCVTPRAFHTSLSHANARHAHRPLPTVYGVPVPPHARGRQPPTFPYAPQLPNDREGVHLRAYVTPAPRVLPPF